MVVLQIEASYGLGSTGNITLDLKKRIEQEGWKCYVASPLIREDLRKDPYVYKVGNWLDHKLHAILSRLYGKQSYYSHVPTIRLIRFIKSIKPDVIQFHDLHSNYINLNLLLGYIAKTNIRLVVTLHDCWFFTGGCFHYTNAHCNRWQLACGNCPKKLQDTPAYLCDRSAQILKDRYRCFGKIKDLKIVGVSNWIAEESKKSVFRGRDVCAIHNGVDMDVFKSTESDIRRELQIENKFVILGPASKWLDGSNAQALNYFAENLQDDECLVLFGCRTKRDDIPNSIIQYGFTNSREELAALYTAADVFVNLTHEDTLPFINLEAQACGIRVITYCNTGAKETVDGVYSKSVETDDYISMLKEIREMKASCKHEPVSGCIEFVRRHFEKNSNYKRYIDLYEEN